MGRCPSDNKTMTTTLPKHSTLVKRGVTFPGVCLGLTPTETLTIQAAKGLTPTVATKEQLCQNWGFEVWFQGLTLEYVRNMPVLGEVYACDILNVGFSAHLLTRCPSHVHAGAGGNSHQRVSGWTYHGGGALRIAALRPMKGMRDEDSVSWHQELPVTQGRHH